MVEYEKLKDIGKRDPLNQINIHRQDQIAAIAGRIMHSVILAVPGTEEESLKDLKRAVLWAAKIYDTAGQV